MGSGIVDMFSGITIMNRPINFQHQPQRRAVEVSDETINHVLATELEAEESPVADQAPYGLLRWRSLLAQLPGTRPSARWGVLGIACPAISGTGSHQLASRKREPEHSNAGLVPLSTKWRGVGVRNHAVERGQG